MGVCAAALRDGPGKAAGAIATATQPTVAVPAVPYRGIHSFRYADHSIFFAREEETQRLLRLVSVYRGVMLYGDSGAGKSSLINAGLIPEAINLGFQPERVRVQPRQGEELVLERISESEESDRWLPSVIADGDETTPRLVISTAAFAARARSAYSDHRPLIIFDQFEEIVTLFDSPETRAAQQSLVDLLVALLRDPISIKVLLAFREDYLGRIKELLAACPELVDQSLRIAPPREDELRTIVSGPFERYPEHFDHEFSPVLVDQLASALAARFGKGEVSLSEVQTVCLRLWQSEDPAALLKERGVGGLLEDYLGEELARLPATLRPAAVALLAQMVTSAGTRNVIAADDLDERVRQEGDDIPRPVIDAALERLSQSRLVRSERRRDLELYEITSEFLVPWISRRRTELDEDRRRRRDRRRLRVLWAIIGALLLVVASVAALAVWALGQRTQARTEARMASSLGLAADAGEEASSGRLDAALVLALSALEPYHAGNAAPALARVAMLQSLVAARNNGVLGLFHGTVGQVYAAAFSADGRTLTSFGADDQLRRWDVRTHREVGTPLPIHVASVTAVAFSPDGRTLAIGGNGVLDLWQAAAGRRIASVPTSDLFNALVFSPDGRELAQIGVDMVIRDAASGAELRTISGGSTTVFNTIAFLPHGRTVATAGFDQTIRFWDAHTGRQLRTLTATASVENLAIDSSGQWLAAGLSNGKTQVWSLTGSRVPRSLLPGCNGNVGVSNIAFSPAGSTVAGACGDGAIHVWSLTSGSGADLLRSGHQGQVTSLAFSHDGRGLVSTGSDSTIRLWALRAPPPNELLTLHSSVLSNLPSFTNTVQASGIALWRVGTATPRVPPGLRADDVAALSPGGRTLAAAVVNKDVMLWSIPAGKQAGSVPDDATSFVTSMAFTGDGRALIIGYDDGRVRIWNVPEGKWVGSTLRAGAASVDALAAASGGATLASGDDSGHVQLWSAKKYRPVGRPFGGQSTQVAVLAFSADGRMLASAQASTIAFWKAGAGQMVGSAIGNGRAAVTSLAFSPDGQAIAAGMSDGSVQIWDTSTFKQLTSLPTGDTNSVASVAFWPDGRSVIAATTGGTLRLWRGLFWRDFQHLRNQVCGIVGTGLTHSEWNLYAPRIGYADPCS